METLTARAIDRKKRVANLQFRGSGGGVLRSCSVSLRVWNAIGNPRLPSPPAAAHSFARDLLM